MAALAALAAIVVAGIVVGVLLLAQDDPPETTTPTQTSPQGPDFTEGVLVVDPESNRVSQLAPGAFGSGAFFAARGGAVLAAGEGAVWTTSPGSHEVVRLDPETGEGTTISLPGVGCVSQLVVGEGAVWAVCPRFPDKVYRISPGSLDVVATIPVSQGLDPESIGGVAGAAVGDGAVWVLHAQGLVRVDVASDRGGRPFTITGDAVTVGHRQVWISDALAGTITAFDSRTLETTGLVEVTGSVDDLVAGEGGVWVLNGSAGTVTRIDPVSYETSDPIGGVGVGATDIDAGAGSVWVANPEEGTISVIDPLTRGATIIDIGAPVVTVAVDQHSEQVYVLVRAE